MSRQLDRLFSKINFDGPIRPGMEDCCWEWTAATAKGYGRFSVDGRLEQAHRVMYVRVHGPIPEGLHLDHLCTNRRCVRPSHLEIVTNRENVLRGESFCAANAGKSHCPAGHSYDGANVYLAPNGHRKCRTCQRDHDRRRRRRTKVAR